MAKAKSNELPVIKTAGTLAPSIEVQRAIDAFAVATSKLHELQNDHAKMERRESEILNELRSVGRGSLVDIRAAELLGKSVENSPVKKAAMLREELTSVRDQIPVIRAAIEMQRADVVERARRRASSLRCDELRPQYLARARQVVITALAFCEAQRDAREIPEELERDGLYPCSPLTMLNFDPIGDTRNPNALICFLLAQAEEIGAIQRGEFEYQPNAATNAFYPPSTTPEHQNSGLPPDRSWGKAQFDKFSNQRLPSLAQAGADEDDDEGAEHTGDE